MMKNKAFHAMIIGTCILANSIAGVYADTTAADMPVSIQIEQVNSGDELTVRQNEIDKILFEEHAKDLYERGITITHTGAIADSVEVGVLPNTEENANYIYELIGKDKITLVDGEAYMLMATTSIAPDSIAEPSEAVVVSAPVEKEASPVAAFFGNIWEWIKSIF